MPAPGLVWRHVIIGTHNSWLPGDPRGFRCHDHKIHSSGDYRHPPPAGEHRGLHVHWQALGGAPVQIPPTMRRIIGQALVTRLIRRGLRALVVAVCAQHAHLLTELPYNHAAQRGVIGQCKSASSHAAGHTLPGRVWSAGATFVPIRDRRQQLQVFRYITAHTRQGAWVWTWRDPLPEKENPGVSRNPGRHRMHLGNRFVRAISPGLLTVSPSAAWTGSWAAAPARPGPRS